MNYWLSYGGGVNSTALAILLARAVLPQYSPWRIMFSDTGEEKPETYAYIRDHFEPWLVATTGKTLEFVKPKESVLVRWERLHVTGSRIIRGCTVEGKIKPQDRHVAENGGGERLVGIDASESHRMADKPGIHRPLVDLDIDREACAKIILEEGLPVPEKSGCWCCPFMRVQEVISLVRRNPCGFERIARLETAATEVHGPCPDGTPRTQWGDRTADYWRNRALRQLELSIFEEPRETARPCECSDG